MNNFYISKTFKDVCNTLQNFNLMGAMVLEIAGGSGRSPPFGKRCGYTFQILGSCQGRRTEVAVTTVSNSLILGGWVRTVLKNGDKN